MEETHIDHTETPLATGFTSPNVIQAFGGKHHGGEARQTGGSSAVLVEENIEFPAFPAAFLRYLLIPVTY